MTPEQREFDRVLAWLQEQASYEDGPWNEGDLRARLDQIRDRCQYEREQLR